MFILGIDGGGTKTAALLTDGYLRIVSHGLNGPSNFLRVGEEAAVASIMSVVEEACSKGGIELDQVTAIGAGLGGVDHSSHNRRMREAIQIALNHRASPRSFNSGGGRWGQENLLLTSDAEIALAGATDCQPGVVIISGTGSIAYGLNGRGQKARSGGWGPTFGDEGSGYDIARRALVAVVSSFDGRLRPTVLTERICHYFNIESPADLPRIVYASKGLNIAPLSELVLEAAREGDSVACQIMRDAGMELARTVSAVIKRLHMQQDAFRVCYVGGVFSAGEMILEPIRQKVAELAPRAVVAPPLFPPMIGAIKLALTRIPLKPGVEGIGPRQIEHLVNAK
jgi:N-acetylglucosamine kinase-like BadF-type ATPase